MGGTTNFGIVAVMVLLNVVLDVVQEHREGPMTTETQRRQAGGMAPTGARARARQTVAMTRSFGTHVVVDRFDLSVAEGEAFGLLGRNGAGKSTLTKMLATLLPSSVGSAQVQAFDLVRQARNVRTAIGHVLQSLSADGELTGHENLFVFACLDDIPARPARCAHRQGAGLHGSAGCRRVLEAVRWAGCAPTAAWQTPRSTRSSPTTPEDRPRPPAPMATPPLRGNPASACPAPRTARDLGKAPASALRAMTQAVILHGVAMALGEPLAWRPQALAAVLVWAGGWIYPRLIT